ncbi:hypothetical protein RhiirA5_501494 [Rhizophagus irregularis]|uniref:F-box domain-containing protein n=2 Tax=Rhizophagus irregularis TaxID=588596 RepID=U9TZZ9_RHIID|nr:hypothetical protein GLOIN_2v1764032 [Rhizophagus irregularis DAOM 181602=DAOM 197198]PKC06297.1 hypothetical protein RhiirA5_501494 [Rhizophagus irregularis]PKC62665.1 hypothetical protein RhiirA1_538310 [Rhizophagus irregularis]PKY21448.1 hypothetical protein RhiirB3_525030 [Rhizophagus irregularis]POG80783.1 hypothetical protein GLOIN_2v1764032 [Rhizophagus irregularis DAOM 181602=DAOM 197198]UZO21586.1 hypothetical protein OCT59_013973 [Rhizophagus irregularis]|eukprot:XP_025187649.1 hypothetical protein GLOIN_2v1764032 [Rhizophagus irregularis DAOM 181602=DAOM 197198]
MESEQNMLAVHLLITNLSPDIEFFNFFNFSLNFFNTLTTKIKTENNIKNISKVQSLIISLPPEIFIIICSFLPPNDLCSLSQVCFKFHEYLCTSNSSTTQQIWKESRLKFMPKETMPPPEGMIEKKYVELLIIERGCQICKRKTECNIYWGLEVRCCEKCLIKNCITQDKLYMKKFPREFIDILPYSYFNCEYYYWKKQLDITYPQYCNLLEENKQCWLDDKKRSLDSKKKYFDQRKKTKQKNNPRNSPIRISPPFTGTLLTIYK